MPKQPADTTLKTWPWILGFLICLLVATLIPAIQAPLLGWDIQITRWFNSHLGHSKTFDILVGGINSKAGDRIVIISFALFFLIHSCYQWNQRDVCRKLAFWAWVSILFFFLYQSQRILEVAFDRDSPGKALEDWFNLRDAYDIKAKVSNSKSYPSGHAMAYYFVAFMAMRRSLRTGSILLAMALLVPTTRIMTGAHWASDIFLGSVPISLFLAALFYETRARKLYVFFEYILDGLWRIAVSRHRRNLVDRLGGAWAELLNETPRRKREAHSPGASLDAPQTKPESPRKPGQ